MKFEAIYFEDYEVGYTRETLGRTITETDFVIHAGATTAINISHLTHPHLYPVQLHQ